eukprot:scaffold10514_cov72-Cylindrotheca_fusiformis.AAC.1
MLAINAEIPAGLNREHSRTIMSYKYLLRKTQMERSTECKRAPSNIYGEILGWLEKIFDGKEKGES